MKYFHVNVSNVNITEDIIINAVDQFFKNDLKYYSETTIFKTQLKVSSSTEDIKTLTLKQIHTNSIKDQITLAATFNISINKISEFLNEEILADYLTISYEILDSNKEESKFIATTPDIFDIYLKSDSLEFNDLEFNQINAFEMDIVPILINKEIFSKILRIFFKYYISQLPKSFHILTQLDVRLEDNNLKPVSCAQIHNNIEFNELLEVL